MAALAAADSLAAVQAAVGSLVLLLTKIQA